MCYYWCISFITVLYCHIQNRLDLIRADYPYRVLAKQSQQKAQHDRRAQERGVL